MDLRLASGWEVQRGTVGSVGRGSFAPRAWGRAVARGRALSGRREREAHGGARDVRSRAMTDVSSPTVRSQVYDFFCYYSFKPRRHERAPSRANS